MRTVIDIKTFEHIQIPKNWIACSVCGEYHSPESYRKLDEIRQSRTNCTKCYNLPYEQFKELKLLTEKKKKSQLYRVYGEQLKTKIEYAENSISVGDMIAALQQLPAGARLVMTQEGYYADGKLAGIFCPESEGMVGDVEYYSIGHSSQNY